MKILALSLLMLSSLAAKADVIKSKEHFKKTGKFESFSWAPERYKSSFRYDIFYYIPANLKDKANVNSLIFLHGGGDSTRTRSGAINVVKMYSSDMIRLADEQGFVLVMPSSNGLQWSGHTRGMIRDIAQMMRAELEINSNNIGVSGHSMGGMGITRSYQYGADEFSFFLPMASGIDTTKAWQWNDEFMYKVFNVPYVQLQGKNDHFQVFVERNIEHEKKIKELEAKYGEKSKFEMVFYNGDHNYDLGVTSKKLKELFAKPRDLYQKNLYGTLYTANFTRTEAEKIPYNQDSEARYFWVELTDTDLSKDETTNFTTKIEGQDIRITMPTLPKLSKNLRVYLSERMVDLTQEVRISLNDEVVKVVEPMTEKEKNMDPKDPAFNFNGFVDIKL